MLAKKFTTTTQNPILEFKAVVNEAIEHFAGNKLFALLREKNIKYMIYHKYLKMVFHQVYHSSSSFALAGANCPTTQAKIRDYLIHHADEEKNHWEWVLEDLESTGYQGPDPRGEFPPVACQSYLAYNYFLAIKSPIARLGAAATLEGIGAKYAKKSAMELMSLLKLKQEQLKFVFGHGDTDVGHTNDIFKLLEESNLPTETWSELQNAAYVSSRLYKAMYDEVATLTE